jgi:hypothetical protein
LIRIERKPIQIEPVPLSSAWFFFFENQETPILVFWVFNGPVLNQVLTISYWLRVFLSFINKSFVLGFLNQTSPTFKFEYQQ